MFTIHSLAYSHPIYSIDHRYHGRLGIYISDFIEKNYINTLEEQLLIQARMAGEVLKDDGRVLMTWMSRPESWRKFLEHG